MKSIRIPFDRVKLTLTCLLYLMLFLMMPALCLYISLDPLMIFFLLTICWFMIKAALRNIKRLFKNKPICMIDDKEIQINSLSNQTYIMKWKDLEKVTMKEKHHSVQLLLFGEHVEHASGVYMIHIDYLFNIKQLEARKQELMACFKKHGVAVEVVPTYKKGVRIHV